MVRPQMVVASFALRIALRAACVIGVLCLATTCGGDPPVDVPVAAVEFSEEGYDFTTPYLPSKPLVGTHVSHTFTLTNNGEAVATDLHFRNLNAPFQFLGDAAPGTGGTCGETLAVGASCTVVVNSLSSTFGPYDEQLEAIFFDGAVYRSITAALTGEADNFVFDSTTGFTGSAVNSIAPSIDGTGTIWAVGLQLSAYDGHPISNIARILPDGSFDTTFAPPTAFTPNTLAVNAVAPTRDGKAYVGGAFNNYNTASVSTLIRLNNDGSLDSTFPNSVGCEGNILGLALAQDGSEKLYAIGSFVECDNDQLAGRIARFNTDGSLDTSFNSAIGFTTTVGNPTMAAIAALPDGDVLVAATGTNLSYNGVNVARITRINSDGSLDTEFNAGTVTAGTGPGVQPLNAIAPLSDGSLIIVGAFTAYSATTVNRISKLSATGGLDNDFLTASGTAFNSGVARAVAMDTTGAIYVGTTAPPTALAPTLYNGNAMAGIVKLLPTGAFDASFIQGAGFAGGNINSMALAQDGSGEFYAAGSFTSYKGVGYGKIIRLNSVGTAD